MRPHTRERIERVELDLEQLLRQHAEAGVPELVLVELLREYANRIERRGYVPRTETNPRFGARWSLRRR